MTARSPRGGRLAFKYGDLGVDQSMDAYYMRDALANAALHCADEAGAPGLANFVAPKASLIPGTPAQYLLASTTTDVNVWYPIATCGPYSMPVFSDGTPYLIRVQLFGASQTGDPVDFAVRAGLLTELGTEYGGGTDGDGIQFSPITSTTPVAASPLVPVSDLITLSAASMLGSRVPMPTLDDTGGDSIDVAVFQIYVRVWGRCTGKGADHARLYGLHAAAFVG
jgi:hypothetical protein